MAIRLIEAQAFVEPLSTTEASVSLSARESEVFRLLHSGLSNIEIASELGISVGTMKAHLRGLQNKLGVHDRNEAAVRAGYFLGRDSFQISPELDAAIENLNRINHSVAEDNRVVREGINVLKSRYLEAIGSSNGGERVLVAGLLRHFREAEFVTWVDEISRRDYNQF